MSDFFKNLKVGDLIVIHTNSILHLGRIGRMTKTQFILQSGAKYRRSDGELVGKSDYSNLRISEPTEEILLKIRRERALTKLKNYNWNTQPYEVLECVIELLDN